MIAVLFEVEPVEGGLERYLDLAARLRPELERIEGFVSIERFHSPSDPGRYLSLSYWRDEAAVERWRNVELHRAAQRAGRDGLFADYRLRVARIVRDYGPTDRAQAPGDSRAHHDRPAPETP